MAQRGVNKVIILGNLGQDPETRYAPSGTCFTNMSVATSEVWKDQQGQQQERTEWHRVSLVGKIAEIGGEYLRKGSKVYLEGKLQTRKWQDQQGQDRYTTEVVVDSFTGVMQMLNTPGNDNQQQNGGGQQPGRGQSNQAAGRQPGQPQQPQQPPAGFDQFDDDIPF